MTWVFIGLEIRDRVSNSSELAKAIPTRAACSVATRLSVVSTGGAASILNPAMGNAAKERKERKRRGLIRQPAASGTHPLGGRSILFRILALRSLRSFAAIHRRFQVYSSPAPFPPSIFSPAIFLPSSVVWQKKIWNRKRFAGEPHGVRFTY